jgi:hypothetical protein
MWRGSLGRRYVVFIHSYERERERERERGGGVCKGKMKNNELTVT